MGPETDIKETLKNDPVFRRELRARIKAGLGARLPPVLGQYAYPPPRAVGHSFDSYMLQDVEPGQLRLLEVDERLVLPTNTLVRVLVHSWAVPSLGVKIDAIPGRLNQVWLNINREGVFYGQPQLHAHRGRGRQSAHVSDGLPEAGVVMIPNKKLKRDPRVRQTHRR